MKFKHIKYIKEIIEHPLNRGRKARAFWRYIAWNFGRRLLHKAAYAIELLPGRRIVLSNHENYATLAYTCGLYDFEDMLFLLHLLRKDDCFGDFGSNVGVYSVLAGARDASVLAVEPVTDTYRRLCMNLRMNEVNATPVNCGLADKSGTLTFTSSRGGMNKVARSGSHDTSEVAVSTVDELVARSGLSPLVVKIDVEGYEYPLLVGASKLLSTTLQAVIIELNESGREYGYSDESVHSLLLGHAFAPYQYNPKTRELTERRGINLESFNTIYVKQSMLSSVRERLKQATPVQLGRESY
jgi:FkbM family methyltransferase